jgi:hypothetical protein
MTEEEERYGINIKDKNIVNAGNFKSFKKNQKGLTVMCWFKVKDLKQAFHIVNQGGNHIIFK